MPMIDIYAKAGTFADTHKLAIDAAMIVKSVEGVPDIPMFRQIPLHSSTTSQPELSRISTATAIMYAYRY